jgi:chromosome segregation ATPase
MAGDGTWTQLRHHIQELLERHDNQLDKLAEALAVLSQTQGRQDERIKALIKEVYGGDGSNLRTLLKLLDSKLIALQKNHDTTKANLYEKISQLETQASSKPAKSKESLPMKVLVTIVGVMSVLAQIILKLLEALLAQIG